MKNMMYALSSVLTLVVVDGQFVISGIIADKKRC